MKEGGGGISSGKREGEFLLGTVTECMGVWSIVRGGEGDSF